MLEETRRELAEARERAQLTPTHTFSPLPGFFDRPAEIKALEKALEKGANFTVLFGASSVGKVRGLDLGSGGGIKLILTSCVLPGRLRSCGRSSRARSTMSCTLTSLASLTKTPQI